MIWIKCHNATLVWANIATKWIRNLDWIYRSWFYHLTFDQFQGQWQFLVRVGHYLKLAQALNQIPMVKFSYIATSNFTFFHAWIFNFIPLLTMQILLRSFAPFAGVVIFRNSLVKQTKAKKIDISTLGQQISLEHRVRFTLVCYFLKKYWFEFENFSFLWMV